MNEIKCPHCGEVFKVDESGYADIVRQVRDEQFNRELADRERLMKEAEKRASDLARAEAQRTGAREVAERDARIAELTAALDAAKKEHALASEKDRADAQRMLQEALGKRDAKIAELSARVESAASERDLAVREARMDAGREVDKLKAELVRQKDAADLAQTKALAAVERERDEAVRAVEREQEDALRRAERDRDEARATLERERAVAKAQAEQQKASHALELEQVRQSNEDIIKYKDDEIERLRDMKVRLSTKMVGESLEQHCETEFNRFRMAAFPRAYFEKDNDVVEGSKGDFVFREDDGEGNEVISIMFEMKNENDATATKHKNEDFFKKLDADRRRKGCEYAVLCTLLEPESELYNAGIVDVSYRYPKMYVIRPQFFIPLITLLRNAAMNSLEYRRELAEVRQQNIDVTGFEKKMEDFKAGFERNYDLASKKFETAIDEIDKTISHLQKVRDNLLASENQLRLANKKAQGLTIRKLTHGNKTMKERFDAAREADEAARLPEAVEPADAADADDADAYETEE